MSESQKRPVNAKVASWKVLGKNVKRTLGRELTPVIYEQFHEYYLVAASAPEDTSDLFAGMMEEIRTDQLEPGQIEAETSEIIKKVPNLEKYLNVYLMSHVMTIAAIRYGEAPTDVNIEIPPLQGYIEEILKYVAKHAEADPDMFNPNGGRREIAARKLDAAKTIRAGINEVTEDMLPTEQMITDYIDDIADEGVFEDGGGDMEEDPSEFVVTSEDMGAVTEEPLAEAPGGVVAQEQPGEELKISIPKKNWEQHAPQPQAPQRPDMMAGIEDGNLD